MDEFTTLIDKPDERKTKPDPHADGARRKLGLEALAFPLPTKPLDQSQLHALGLHDMTITGIDQSSGEKLAPAIAASASIATKEVQSHAPTDAALAPTMTADANTATREIQNHTVTDAAPRYSVKAKAGEHIVKSGDTLSQIAINHLGLGPHPDMALVREYYEEIGRVNGIQNLDLIYPGQHFKLPEYTFTGRHKHSNFQNDNGHTNNNEHQDVGPVDRREHNHIENRRAIYNEYQLHNDRQLSPEYTPVFNTRQRDSHDGTFEHMPTRLSPEELEHHKLVDLAHAIITDTSKLTDIENYSRSFAARETRMETAYQQQHMDAQAAHEKAQHEIIGTYREVEKLLKSTGTEKLSQEQLQRLAVQTLHNAATLRIDQGAHNTCQTDVVESMAYMLNPSKAAKVVADVALTGRYTAEDGTTVEVDPTPHGESRSYSIQDGKRSHASEIFQVTGINLAWAKNSGGRVHYEQREKRFDAAPSETGEELIENGKVTQNQPYLFPKDLALMHHQITGEAERPIVIENAKYTDREAMKVDSPDDLYKQLQDLRDNGHLPVILYVNTGNQPFSSENNARGVHAILITGFTPARPGHSVQVMFNNSWGSAYNHGADRPVDLETLYAATINPSDKAAS